MTVQRFMKLVEEQQGFEFYQAYRDEVDHILGGKGNTYWYTVMKNGKVKESYVGVLEDGAWHDVLIKGSGAKKTTKEQPAGSTIERIAKQAYLAQDEKWVTRVTDPKVVEDGHPHHHFVKGFGDKALDVSAQYGVSIGYNDLADEAGAFRLRYLYTGADVELP